jgi:hypothetical protein
MELRTGFDHSQHDVLHDGGRNNVSPLGDLSKPSRGHRSTSIVFLAGSEILLASITPHYVRQ